MRLFGRSVFLSVALLTLLAACGDDEHPEPLTAGGTPVALGNDVTVATASEMDDGQWVMPAKNYASTRYSTLDQIDTASVKNLRLAWTFSTGVLNGHEAGPLVVNNTMYLVTPWPNYLYALDLTKNGALKWRYNPSPSRASQGVACCDVVNRGAVYANGKIYYNTLDAHVVAVDAETGKEVWKTKVGDINIGETITMAPLFVKGKILSGNSGGEMGVRGWIVAVDAESGEIAWRAYNTGPDEEVLIGENFKPYYPQYVGEDLGVRSWPPDHWKIGGGTMWGWISYDPEMDLIFHGTANPGPWNPEMRPGDNLWTAGIFARDPDDGSARWFYQWAPHDLFDYDGINENILLDLQVDGGVRKVLVRPERTGYIYVLDRTNGQVLSADPFTYITTTKGVNLETGRPIHVEEKKPGTNRLVKEICPAAPGGKDWQPSAFSPRTKLLYVPSNYLCMDMEGVEANYIAGTPYVGAVVKMYPAPGDGHRGEFFAWDVVNRRKVWSIEERFPAWSGALVTAGDVVFYGTMDGFFKAVDAKSGKELWRFSTGSGIIGQPITYRGPDGRQYVAIMAGVGGWSGAVVSAGLDTAVPYGALGFVNAMKDLGQYTAEGGTVYVFALPETGQPRTAAQPTAGGAP